MTGNRREFECACWLGGKWAHPPLRNLVRQREGAHFPAENRCPLLDFLCQLLDLRWDQTILSVQGLQITGGASDDRRYIGDSQWSLPVRDGRKLVKETLKPAFETSEVARLCGSFPQAL